MKLQKIQTITIDTTDLRFYSLKKYFFRAKSGTKILHLTIIDRSLGQNSGKIQPTQYIFFLKKRRLWGIINVCINIVVYLLNSLRGAFLLTISTIKHCNSFSNWWRILKILMIMNTDFVHQNTDPLTQTTVNFVCVRDSEKKGAPYIWSIAYTSNTVTIVLIHTLNWLHQW